MVTKVWETRPWTATGQIEGQSQKKNEMELACTRQGKLEVIGRCPCPVADIKEAADDANGEGSYGFFG